MKYDVKFTSQFKKDLKLAKKQNKNIDKLYAVIETLAEGNTLDPKQNDVLVLMLSRLGTHSELFKK